MGSIKFLLALSVTIWMSGRAAAQCYAFGAQGASFSINITSATTTSTSSSAASFSVQQQSTLVEGSSTYTATGPGSIGFNYVSTGPAGGFTSFAISVVGPAWGVSISGVGLNNSVPTALPATFPPVSTWNLGLIPMIVTFSTGASQTFMITTIGSCSSATGPGGSTSSVNGETLGNPSDQQGCAACGQPIAIGTGNMYEQAVDYRTFGANMLSFTRYYNSLSAAATLAASLGKNWRSNYDRYLQISSGSVIAERPDGRQVTFTSSGSGWSAPTDIDLTLVNSGTTWTLSDHNDNVETYSASGNQGLLQTIQARNGYKQTLQYNSTNQVVSVTDSYNRQLLLTYSNGLLQTVATPDGLVLTYGFTSAGGSSVLSSVSYSTKPVTTKSYLYENSSVPSALTAIVDENGARYMSWTYDSQGRALTSQLGTGADVISVAYNDSDGSRTVTGPLGQSGVYHFSTLQNVPKVTEIDFAATSTTAASKTTFGYDSNGYLASRTDWNGNLTTMVNNSRGLPATVVEASGTTLARTTTITYHASFRLPVQIVQPMLTQSFTYDTNGELLTWTVTDTTTTPSSSSGQTRTWTFTWSNFLLASVKSPRTDVSALTQFAYDSSGAITSVTNALNQVFRMSQHLPGGLPTTIIDPNGVTTTVTYDARQRMLNSTIATATGPLTSKITYDAAGNIVTLTKPDGSAYNNTYDAAHRLTAIVDSLEQSQNYTLNSGNRITAFVIKDASGKTQLQRSAVYDALGRAVQMIAGAGQTTSFSYDLNGNLTEVTDGLNRARKRSFDALNRLVTSTDPAQNVTTITYDPLSRPATITDPNGATTQYTYDGFGELIQEVNPASGTTVFHYNASGKIVQRLDARGVVTNYAYDALDRLVSITYPGSTAENVTMTYDQGQLGVGRLTSVSDAAGTLTRTYDERGNMLTENRSQLGTTLTTSYAYDAASRVVSVTYPSHSSVTFTRDTMGRVTSASAASGSGSSRALFSGVGYQPLGPINAVTYGNGIAETRVFDADYRLTGLSATVENLTYGYDAANNVLSIADGIQAANAQALSYDALNRLTGASGAYGKLGYTYDANGNRLTESSAATNDGLAATSFIYTQSGRLAAAYRRDQQLSQYTYDAFGHRVVKNGSTTGTTRYQYGIDGTLLEEADGQGNPQVDYVYLEGRPVATIAGDGTLSFLHDDRLGAPQMATNASQSVVWSTTYQPFGQIANAPTLIANDLRLPGQESDAETGLYHNGFRDYAPAQGKYIQSDPVGLVAGTNRYAYADSNPAGAVDPSGLDSSLSDQLSAVWQQAASLCSAYQGSNSCSTLTQAQIAYNLVTTPQTAYVPTLPSDIGPPAPATPFNPLPEMSCTSGLPGCTPEAQAAVTQAGAINALNQLNYISSTIPSQVLLPTAEKTFELSEWAFAAAAGAPELGVPTLVEVPEGAETVVNVGSFLFGSDNPSGIIPSGSFLNMQGITFPSGSTVVNLGATAGKDIIQGIYICPITGQVIGGN